MKNNFTKMAEATLRLFKSVYTEGEKVKLTEDQIVSAVSKGLLFNTDGFTDNETVLKLAIDMYGKDIFKLNNTFHKTWKTVEEIDPGLHYLQQVLHYITTYGYEALGIDYDSNDVYIPKEKINLPEDVKPYNFILIKTISKEELQDRINTLITSGVALSQYQVDDIVYLINTLELKPDFDNIKNKEVRTILWLNLDVKPYINVDEFLRALTYKAIGQTLVLRSYRNHSAIKQNLKYNTTAQKCIAQLLDYYVKTFGMENVASQFLRNKMLFLAFKNEATKSTINSIRRAAVKYHKPLEEVKLSLADIEEANIWQLVKYYNLCLSNINPTEDKLYQIRNGKNYLKENKLFNEEEVLKVTKDRFTDLLTVVTKKIKEKLSHLEGKVLVIPDYIDYKVPSSLKRLASGVPEGTVITFPEGSQFTIGVHWENQIVNGRERRIDLDLHANSLYRSIGWNSSFRNDEVLFSGDMTNAPIDKGGASEALLFKDDKSQYIITLNDFTQENRTPYKFIFDFDTAPTIRQRDNYGNIFSPNSRTLNAVITKERGSNTLGLVSGNKFYFLNSSIFEGPITYNDDLLKRLLVYYEESQHNQLNIKQLADIVGIKVVSKITDVPRVEVEHEDAETTLEYVPYIDLSLEAITEDTFAQLFEKSDSVE